MRVWKILKTLNHPSSLKGIQIMREFAYSNNESISWSNYSSSYSISECMSAKFHPLSPKVTSPNKWTSNDWWKDAEDLWRIERLLVSKKWQINSLKDSYSLSIGFQDFRIRYGSTRQVSRLILELSWLNCIKSTSLSLNQ